MTNVMRYCIVNAKSENIPYDMWKYIKTDPLINRTHSNLIEINLDQLIEKNRTELDYELRRGYGIFAKCNKAKYVISCYHIIQRNDSIIYSDIRTEQGTIRINYEIVGTLQEIDLIVLKPIINEADAEKLNIDYLDLENVIHEDIIQNSHNIEYIKKMKDHIKLLNYDVKILDISSTYLKSIIIPKIPILKFTCHDKNSDDFDIEGLSGSPLLVNNEIIGITFSYSHNGHLEAVPIYIISVFAYALINEKIANKNKKINLKGYIFNTCVADVEIDGNQYVCHAVLNTQEIFYKLSCNEGKRNKFRFQKDDVIMEVNGNKFNENGDIYVGKLNYYLEMDTFCMIQSMMDKSLTFRYIRSSISKCKSVSIEPNEYNSMCNINITNLHEYVYWNGLIFCELSEELLLALKNAGKLSSDQFYGDYRFFSSDRNKYVILIDVNHKALNSLLFDDFNKIGLPLIRSENGNKLVMFDKIGRKKVGSLRDAFLELNKNSYGNLERKYFYDLEKSYKLCV